MVIFQIFTYTSTINAIASFKNNISNKEQKEAQTQFGSVFGANGPQMWLVRKFNTPSP